MSKYKYGFNNERKNIITFDKGINENVVKEISKIKEEANWVKDFRLKSCKKFTEMKLPDFGPSLENIKFDEITYYVKPTEKSSKKWEDVPKDIKETFEKLGIPESEAKYLSGVSTQYDSEVVYENMMKEVIDQKIIFCDMETAFKKHEKIVKEYFSKLVPANDNKFAALNSAVFSGGSFIYVPKNAKLSMPLQAYFRINTEAMGQFERTLIIVDEGAELHYIEGCTAPIYSKDSLHSAVVEIFVKKNAKMRYTTIQNWSKNVYNLVTKRSIVEEGGLMEWVDGNLGSKITMKYPAIILKGDKSQGNVISVAYASENQVIDAGAKIFHLGNNTKSNIISKSLSKSGGKVIYRGIVDHKNSDNCFSKIECDTIILDEKSSSDTIPINISQNNKSIIIHEATVSQIDNEKLFYLTSKGISEERAKEILVMGFINDFSKELPMEYAIELNRLINHEMENSIG